MFKIIESVFKSGLKLKKAERIKRKIEKPELEKVELIRHDFEDIPAVEMVSHVLLWMAFRGTWKAFLQYLYHAF